MRLLVLGAAGRTGRLVVQRALGHGHEVRAFVHVMALESPEPGVEVVAGDVLSFDDVDAAMKGCDAVAFALGSNGGRDVRVFSEGIANVLHAMAANGVDTLVALSAAGAFARDDSRISLPFRALIKTVLKPVYDDLERMEQRIAASGVSWTIIRPVGLSDAPATGHYRLSHDGTMLPKSSRVSREDVAALMLKALETGVFSRSTLLISR